jgi:DNA polymerase II small subunit
MNNELPTNSRKTNNHNKMIEYAEIKGIVLAKEALMELNQNNYKEIIDKANELNLFVISKEFIKDNPIKKKEETKELPNKMVEIEKTKKIYAKDINSDLYIDEKSHVTDKHSVHGKIDDFQKYFKNRYKLLNGILNQHKNVNPITSRALKNINNNMEVTLIGMLVDKRNTKTGNLMLIFDDPDGLFKVIVKSNTDLHEIAKKIILDDVVLIKGNKFADKMIFAKEFQYPELPDTPIKKANREVNMLITSDFHLGSKLFYENEFQKLIDWLNFKNASPKEEKKIEKIKYILIPGDLVDGIGIYPGQEKDLKIVDIYEQYEKLGEYLKQIPEYIDIVLTPGNHDAVRIADPQPAIPKDIAKSLYELPNVKIIGSPSTCKIEGLNVLMYHGYSMHGLQSQLKIDNNKPEIVMKEYLKRRDLCPTYGLRHPIVPEEKEYMIIKEKPDIFVNGHIHINAYDFYRGTMLINSGTWLGQTIIQKEYGVKPTPGKVPIIKLDKMQIFEKVFINGNSEC